VARHRVRNQKKASARGPAELGVAPHGEAKVIEMPIRTDQRRETKEQNIAQTPNTKAGRLAPSVGNAKVARIDRRNKKALSPATDASGESQHKTVKTITKKNTRNTA
jgi:hypothetical protein